MDAKYVTSLSSVRPTGYNIPVAVGLYGGSGIVACPAAGLTSSDIQGGTTGCYAEILLHSLHDSQVTCTVLVAPETCTCCN